MKYDGFSNCLWKTGTRKVGWSLVKRILILHLILFLPQPWAQAAVRVWDGSHSGYWSNPQNWSGNVAPAAGDDLVFPAGAANLTNTNDLTSLTFNSITVTGSNYVFRASGTGALQLTGGISAQHSAGSCTVAQPVRLRAAQTWECTTAGARLEMSADLALDLGSYTLTVAGSGRVQLDATISGTGGLVKKRQRHPAAGRLGHQHLHRHDPRQCRAGGAGQERLGPGHSQPARHRRRGHGAAPDR